MTEELKKAMENANTEEEKMAVAEKFRDELMNLSEAELKDVNGGIVSSLAGPLARSAHA